MLTLPPFSTDTQRFLADGINVSQGRNPYTSAPPIAIEYAHLRSFYPPLQEAFFGAAALLWPSPLVFRVLGGCIELAFVAWFLFRKRKKTFPGFAGLFLLFNPLSIHEIWREGHLDHVGVIFLYLAIVNVRSAFAFRRKPWRGYFFAMLAIGWKFVGVLAVPFALRKRPRSRIHGLGQKIFSGFAVACGSFFAVQLLPALLLTPFAESGLTVYANYWHHGNGVVRLLASNGFAAPHAVYLIQRGILLLFGFVAVLYLVRRIALYDAVYFSLGSMLVLFPVQHPWYYFLLFPVILLSPRWRLLAGLTCFLAPLTYLGYTENWKSSGFFIILAVWTLGSIIHFTRYKKNRQGWNNP